MSAMAVIDSQIDELRASGETGNVENLIEARAAFAELIEADAAYDVAMKNRDSRAYLDCAAIKQRRIQQRLTDACHRRNKALARVRGDA
ncbi:hypothetical protein [Stenotrophomonas sp. SORGH_AS_0321]|uniref:hypothetical protein n=1 Tax=Stenotrophomonas sp. SORGH_AS_0321 TaxID=3041787 RepID=UPI002857484D|nr:hypothetical protein [Stenotrophomonas sp. SORGH_AS_0321]MDR6094929.1 alpha-D-ribose 1-methylphosphonate 5-triphosphate synthase subunit PhnH [Stenotrophomonas sp. SORGH_AS_0321]